LCVGKSPACPFDVFDRGVVVFHFRCCRVGDDEDLNLFPQAADRAPEPVRFRLRSTFDAFLQSVFRSGRVGEGSGGEQGPELFFDQPAACSFPVANTVLRLFRTRSES
jgi:hypothetical protein